MATPLALMLFRHSKNQVRLVAVFQYNDLHHHRRQGHPLVGGQKDVCKLLGLGHTTNALRSLDDDEKMDCTISAFQKRGRGGDNGKRVLVNEPDLYKLIFRSRKPEAEDL